MTRTGVIGRLLPEMERFLNRQILGIEPDPDQVPPPSDLDRFPVPEGIDRRDEFGPVWILDREYTPKPFKRRTGVGALAYRFATNREFDCGWRLVDAATRCLTARGLPPVDVVTIIPPPPVFAPVRALEWTGVRLANALNAVFLPDLIVQAAPLTVHPDTKSRGPIPPVEMFSVDPNLSTAVAERLVLLIDWHWHAGRSITTVARQLARHGAAVIRFAFLG